MTRHERSRGPVWSGAARSMFDGIRWPALLSGHVAALASLMAQLERSQWLAPEAVEALQWRQLEALLDHARAHAPFYRDRLASAGLKAGAPLTREAWERIPVLERSEIQARGAEMRTAAPPQHGSVREIATSGSTGRPIRVITTELAGFFWGAMTLRAHDWGGWDEAGVLAAIKWFPDGVAAWPTGASWANWGEPYASLCESGPSFALSIATTVGEQAQWLARVQPDYLTVFPSIVPDLIAECERSGVQLSRLKHVRTIGECLDPATRELCSRRWGVPVQDAYSAQEVGYMALQCPEHTRYHVQSECVKVEVLDAQGRACGPGETGRVVVTPLHNFAMPLLRYAIGDHAEVSAPCPCGRGLPAIERILGRSRNMLELPGGARVWPRLSELRYGEVLPVKQFQVVQTGPISLEVRLVAERAGSAEEEARLAAIIAGRIGYPFEISFRYLNAIPRSTGGKFEDFKSEM